MKKRGKGIKIESERVGAREKERRSQRQEKVEMSE
jgi:hypothetical protein